MKRFYQNKNDDPIICDVNIFIGDSNKSKIEIVQISDIHFNMFDEYDDSPTLQSTKLYRKWLADGESVDSAVRAMNYASQFDQTVITGDILDFLSHGTMSLMDKYIWNADPEILCAVGNHEFVQQMQGIEPEIYTEAERRKMVEDYWHHDITYTSKLVKDKVLCVVMDNANGYYTDKIQYDKLECDIKKARENKQVILIFQHFPLATDNEKYSSMWPLTDEADTANCPLDFCKDTIGDSHKLSRDIHNLIKSNADVIKGIFTGHWHGNYHTEIDAFYTDENGKHKTVIPQYILTSNAYNGTGHVNKINVYY